MKVRVDITLEGHDEPDETVELPFPEAPGIEDFGPGHWRWVGPLPRTRVDITDEYCVGVYVLKRTGKDAMILGGHVPVARRRGVNATRKDPPEDEPTKPHVKPIAKPAPDLPKAVRARIVKLYKGGMGVPEICETMDEAGVVLSKAAVYRLLRSEGVKVRPRGWRPPEKAAPARKTAKPEPAPTPEDRDSRNQEARKAERDRLFPRPKHRRHAAEAAPAAPPPPSAPTAPTVEKGGVVTLSDADTVRDLIGRHFKGELTRPLAERFHTTQPVVIATLHRAYDLMDLQFSATGPAPPMGKALWEDELNDPARKAICQRIAEGR